MRRQPLPCSQRRAFTLMETLVVISLITLLISMLTPQLRNAKENARAAVCLAQLHDVGNAFISYTDDFRQEYPYGVPKPATIVDHPQNQQWAPGGGGGIPPQQQFFTLGYIRDPKVYLCPTDPHPGNYVWWEYSVHPNITTGSSYMFSEYALFGIAWQTRTLLRTTNVWQPSGFAYATDGWECPNGWTWATIDPEDPTHDPTTPWSVRIDWSHLKSVNVLYGDNHAARQPQKDARLNLRTHPQANY
jgi:type II secretory pathway pseudopilin PulG